MGKRHALKLALEGIVQITSGEMLVIDPGYLKHCGDLLLVQHSEKLGEEFQRRLTNIQTRRFETYSKQLRVMIEAVKGSDHTQKTDSLKRKLASYDGVQRDLEKLELRVRSTPSFAPPYLIHGSGQVLSRNPLGDGDYPIVRTPRAMRVVFNYHCEPGSLTLDEQRLEGELLGRASVDTGMLMVSDASRVRIAPRIRDDLYWCGSVPNGTYACRFIDGNYALSIRKCADSGR